MKNSFFQLENVTFQIRFVLTIVIIGIQNKRLKKQTHFFQYFIQY